MGDVDISTITPMNVELWKNKLGITLSPTTASIYIRTLKSLFNKAKKMGLIDVENPFNRVSNVRVPAKSDLDILRRYVKEESVDLI